MTYIPNTVLRRKEPFEGENFNDELGVDLSVFNEVRVVGQSPVVEAGRASEWEGEAGKEVSVTPTSFGPVVDRPQGELERDYEIVSVPEIDLAIQQPTAVREIPGPTPEQQFAAAANAEA